MSTRPLVVVAAALLSACAAPLLDPDDPTLLVRPFSADQIAGAMPVGSVIDLEQATPMGRGKLRWTVVEADAEGCVIEFTALDADGTPIGLPERRRQGWIELRDHASFPAATSTVEDDRRLTPLGLIEGRLYTTTDEAKGVTSRMFFSPMYPGPPLWVELTRGGALISTTQQTARR